MQRDIDRLAGRLRAPRPARRVIRSGSTTGTRVWKRTTFTCVDRAERAHHARARRRGDSTSGSPPVRITSQISGCARDIGERRVELRSASSAAGLPARPSRGGSRSGNRPAQTCDELQQHAVGIAVDDAFDRAVRVVADRIGALLRRGARARARRARTGARSGRADRRGRSARPWPA